MLYILVLELFRCRLRANPVLHGFMLPGSIEEARYTTYGDNVSMLVTSNVEVVEVSKEIGRYEVVTGAKINHEKSVSLRLAWWKGCVLLGHFSETDRPSKILSIRFSPDLQLEKKWSEALEKVVAMTALWLQRRLSLKG